MERTGLIAQLFRFADALVGWLPGGFGIATVLACVLFAAISGSSVAMAAAMSVIAIPEMIKRGYPPWVAAGLVATSGGIAILIPPSIPLILYGVVTETSVVRLFFAGVIPGLLLAVANIVTIIGLAWYLKLPRGKFDAEPHLAGDRWRAARRSACRCSSSAGSTAGCSRPTEAAAAACGYALALRADHRARRVPARAAAHHLPRAQPDRGGPVPGRQRGRVPVPGGEPVLAADHHQDRDRLGTDADGLHRRVHRGRDDPRLLRRRRGDDPADRAGGVPGRLRAQDRSDPPRDPAHAHRRDEPGHAAGRAQPVRGQRHFEDSRCPRS